MWEPFNFLLVCCKRACKLNHCQAVVLRECHMTKPLLSHWCTFAFNPFQSNKRVYYWLSSAIRIEKWFYFVKQFQVKMWPAQLMCKQLSVWVTDWKRFSLISCLSNQTLLHSRTVCCTDHIERYVAIRVSVFLKLFLQFILHSCVSHLPLLVMKCIK